jgi:Glycosyl hydrolases family 2
MNNRIVAVRVEDRSLDPASVELWVTVTPEHLTPTTEVRGRLMGPGCPYAQTVEIAYPLAPLRRPAEEMPGSLRFRVVIPEASLWAPDTPYLYSGPVELWQDGQRCDRRTVRHGLRQIVLGTRGVQVNGRPLTLHVWAGACSAEQALALRQEELNTLLLPLNEESSDVWEVADRFGLLIIGHVGIQAATESESGQLARLLQTFSRHPCSLGLVAGPGWLESDRWGWLLGSVREAGKLLVGIEVEQQTPTAIPAAVSFVVCTEEHVSSPSDRPLLVRRGTGTPEEMTGGPLILGTIR